VSTKRPVKEAAQLMIEHDIEQIPIASGGRLSGIVQDMDLLEAIR
jgi:CBS domain-containing protein